MLKAAPTARTANAQTINEREKALLEKVIVGDERAFEELYRSYHARLFRFLNNILDRPQLVEEVLDDTLLAVWTGPARFRGDSKVSTWIFAIAYYKALKALRRLDEPVEERPEVVSEDSGPDECMWQVQRSELLMAAIHDLSASQRVAVNLTYFDHLSQRDVAAIMHCPVDTVKTRVFHARRHLKRLIGGNTADWMD